MTGSPAPGSLSRPSSRPAEAPAGSLESALAHVLQAGTYLSVALIAAGSVLLVASGTSPLAGGPDLALHTVVAEVLMLRPAGFLWLGILGVLATPGLRVLRALIGFGRTGERVMAGVAAAVLVVIAVGVFVGVVSG